MKPHHSKPSREATAAPPRRVRLVAGPDLGGARVLDALFALVPREIGHTVPRAELRRAVVAGAVLVNGAPVRRPGETLPASGARLEIALRAAYAGRGVEAEEGEVDAAGALAILFEDEWVIAVAKPPGLLTHQSADTRRPHLFGLVQELLARRGGGDEGGLPYLGSHQRLDKDTSGVVLFAKARAANEGLAQAFEGREVEKVYLAVVGRPARPLADAWVCEEPLALFGSGKHAQMKSSPEGQAATTEFRVLSRRHEVCLVECRPRTGRKHQIRAHLAIAGAPIAGDLRYGGVAALGGVVVPRVLLHAGVLSLAHPMTGAPLRLSCPLPADFAPFMGKAAGGGKAARQKEPRRGLYSRGPSKR
ncbi:MAG: RluA family pseudouridine synthase [Vicinamibacteria bacterium]|nr:RluA family pseudouridine synthase [Vicinamibacteria bacterium]